MTEMKHRFESEVVRFVIANALKLVDRLTLLLGKRRLSFKYANYYTKQDLNLINFK